MTGASLKQRAMPDSARQTAQAAASLLLLYVALLLCWFGGAGFGLIPFVGALSFRRAISCCPHRTITFFRNVYGDEITHLSGKRSVWLCLDCGSYLTRDELNETPDAVALLFADIEELALES